jgi:hypothetical protein
MTITELLQELRKLSPEERESLRRELGACEPPSGASPEMVAAIGDSRRSSGEQGSLPVEDAIQAPTSDK